jgi:hypothetical protein
VCRHSSQTGGATSSTTVIASSSLTSSVSADGMTLQVVGAAKAQVGPTVGMPVERLEVRAIPRMSDRRLWLESSRG